MAPLLESVQVGRPQIITDKTRWTTAIFKKPVVGPIWLDWLNLEGDAQADLRVHGGPDKAVCVYSADHFEKWRRELAVDDCRGGAFGENFSIAGQTEQTASIGDVYEIGDALVQISQPRGPCSKLARRWKRADFVRLVLRSGRTGWYLRVLRPGRVAAGEQLRLVDRPCAEWTIARVNDITYASSGTRDAVAMQALADCESLAESWRTALIDR
jgi:MOSC domain-containing protein YiiM